MTLPSRSVRKPLRIPHARSATARPPTGAWRGGASGGFVPGATAIVSGSSATSSTSILLLGLLHSGPCPGSLVTTRGRDVWLDRRLVEELQPRVDVGDAGQLLGRVVEV